MANRTKEQISYNMSRVRSTDSALEKAFADELTHRGITTYSKNDKSVFGKPDFVFKARKVAVFCDSEFWHGYDWKNTRHAIKSRQDFWIPKIEKNIRRDKKVTAQLKNDGWTVLRFWEFRIKNELGKCVNEVISALRDPMPQAPFRTIDLCAGIGGIRRGFELCGSFRNVLSAEKDEWACRTYEHIYGDNPNHDVTAEEFKLLVEQTPYDVLLAGFPCQTFSRVGLEEGFENEEKGKIFYHIAEIIRRTRPCAFLLENVDHLVTHDKGATFKFIIEELTVRLKYKVIGVSLKENGEPVYTGRDFIRNSRNFGVPQNRPRTYIIGFDSERFPAELLDLLPAELPKQRAESIYSNLNDLLEPNVEAKYYMASGYLETLKRHRERQEGRGYGFGYRVVNEKGIASPVANTLLATGGSGKERNLIYDPKDGIGGTEIKGKKTPLNDEGIRVMTPTEWGRLQGFINYAFIGDDGQDGFSFPEGIPDAQKYKQFGNSVTIPAIEEMAKFILECFKVLRREAV
ncbi:MAG TPA: DNA mismatch endonuclease Vsr [Eubacteriales bacterium]|nr:DNA mismatch endonuclease Vsr [Eubacteriales bacterium]